MEEFRPTFDRIREELKSATCVLVIAHQKPDGDCLGSALAFSHFLEREGTPHVCFCNDPVPDRFTFLPRSERMVSDHEHVLSMPVDRVVVLDSGDLAYAGVETLLERLQDRDPVVINIDHHPTNDRYGHVNLVHPKASSTSEILFHLFDHHRVQIDRDMATCLLTGILTDTGSFSNLATTPSSLEVAGRLLARGARLKHITNHTLRNQSLVSLKLWGRALSRLREDPASGFVTTAILRSDFDELGLDDEGFEGIANFLNSLDDAKAIAVLREERDGRVKISMRTTQPNVDVAKVAKAFGGGGHKKAAGFAVPGTLRETDTAWVVDRSDNGEEVRLALPA